MAPLRVESRLQALGYTADDYNHFRSTDYLAQRWSLPRAANAEYFNQCPSFAVLEDLTETCPSARETTCTLWMS